MNSLYKNKIKITVLITSIKQRKITIETANYYSQICTEVVLVDEQKPCLSTLDIIALKKKNITYIPYKGVNSKKMITQAYQKRLIAVHESNNRYVVHSNHDERYTYFGLLACVSELKKNKKLTFCIGQAIAVRKDVSGIYYTRSYKSLNRYQNIKKRVDKRLYYHAKMYAPIAHYAVWRRKAYLKTTEITILVHDKIPVPTIFDELIFELAADLNGNSKAIAELYWIRNRVNKSFNHRFEKKQNIFEITKNKLNILFNNSYNIQAEKIMSSFSNKFSYLVNKNFLHKCILVIKKNYVLIKLFLINIILKKKITRNIEGADDVYTLLNNNKIKYKKNDLNKLLNSVSL
jgi:hypothetical protein